MILKCARRNPPTTLHLSIAVEIVARLPRLTTRVLEAISRLPLDNRGIEIDGMTISKESLVAS
jgi:hypothetical protein